MTTKKQTKKTAPKKKTTSKVKKVVEKFYDKKIFGNRKKTKTKSKKGVTTINNMTDLSSWFNATFI